MATKDQQEAEFARLMASDPEIQLYISHLQSKEARGWDETAINQFLKLTGLRDKIQARAEALGIDAKRWMPEWKKGRGLTINHQNWIERNPNKAAAIAAGGIFGGIGLAGGFAGGGTAAAGGSAAPSAAGTGFNTLGNATFLSTAGPAPAASGLGGATFLPAGSAAAGGGTAAGAGAGTAAATTAGKSWMSRVFDDDMAQDLVKAGIGSGLNYLQRRGERPSQEEADRAREEQRRATAEANQRLDRHERLSGEIYNQQRSDFQNLANVPYQTLGNFLGMDIADVKPVTFQNAAPANPTQIPSGPPAMHPGPFAPGSRTGAPGSGLGAPGTTAPAVQPNTLAAYSGTPPMVTLRAPTGETQQVSERDAPMYEARGAVRL